MRRAVYLAPTGPGGSGYARGMASRPSPRPRFELRTRFPPAEVRARVQAMIEGSPRLRGIAFEHRLEIAIDGEEHHFWSPQVVVDVKPVEGGALLTARFGPDPYVWALYLLVYVSLSVVTFFASLFGAVQWWLAQTPTAFFVAPAAAALAGLAYGASFVGQGLASEHMYFLRATLTDAVEGERGDPTGGVAVPFSRSGP